MEECRRLRKEQKLSLHRAATDLCIPHSLLIKLDANIPALVAAQRKIRRSISRGLPSQLDPVKEQLLKWIFARHEQAMALTMQQVVLKAPALLKFLFGDNTSEAGYKAVSRFLKCNLFVYRSRMNNAISPPEETHIEVSEFMAAKQPLLYGINGDKCWMMINMDRTPLWVSYLLTKTRPQVLQRHVESNCRTDHGGIWSLAPAHDHFQGTASWKDHKKRAAAVQLLI